ncbi:hypothetical protein RSOLAG22IIIB_13148 [Rhizoctonia solani]|uniref:Uncharacterized protein n=1 Tax=Rhizoctonia solani TaxID=456999 RepID=A0A0K6GIJ4_9AGAM|nr:hypothetical protein RSOLAG22IIIB_13148 [Rhizoctonia solani]
MLTRLDAVESRGNDEVWRIQKEVVKTIKREWKRPDGMKAEAWKRTNEPEPEIAKSSTESEVDPTSVTFTENEDEKMEDGLQANVCLTPTTVATEPTVSDDVVPTYPEPFARSLAPPPPSDATDSDSDLEIELEEYLDVGTVFISEGGAADLEELEKGGDLELVRDWDLDFWAFDGSG